MDKELETHMTTMLSTFSVTVAEARDQRICIECRRCANRGCSSVADWTAENWTDYDLTAFCPSCIRTEQNRVNAALDRHDADDDERNWGDLTTWDWSAL